MSGLDEPRRELNVAYVNQEQVLWRGQRHQFKLTSSSYGLGPCELWVW